MVGGEVQKSWKEEFARLARFGANLADAYSCFIFFPANTARALGNPAVIDHGNTLILTAFHSLSQNVIHDSMLTIPGGLYDWVAAHGRSIHVSPFEHDSRTLGVYSVNEELKSFIGIPIGLGKTLTGAEIFGVLGCDSKKAFAFSKLQGKLLEELALQISCTVNLIARSQVGSSASDGWDRFIERAELLLATLGIPSVEALRMRVENFSDFEARLGSQRACDFMEQFVRLISQALPPRSPIAQLANGDLVMVVDNMMTSFYESKILALARHLCPDSFEPKINFYRSSSRRRSAGSISELVAATIPDHLLLEGGLRAVQNG